MARQGGRDAAPRGPSGRRTGRSAGQRQPRGEGGEGRPALRLLRPGRGRRRQGPGRLRQRQGARGAGGGAQGDRAGQARHDPRAAAAGPHAAPRHHRPFRCRPGAAAHRPAGHRHHRRRPDARGVRGPGHPRRRRQVAGLDQPAQHGQGDLRRAGPCGQPASDRGQARPQGRRDPRPARHRPTPPRRRSRAMADNAQDHPGQEPDRPARRSRSGRWWRWA